MRKLYVLLLTLLTAAFSAVLMNAPAHAADNGSWSVYPAVSKLGGRPYFYLSADPGTTINDKVTVTNKTAQPLNFRLYGADAYNTERDGGFAVRSLKEKQTGVGAWVRPGLDRITVPPHGAVTVPFTLTVPEGAMPGDHPGALVALDERVEKAKGDVAVGVRWAVGARVYLRVTGPTVTGLAVEHVSLAHSQPLIPGTGKSRTLISYTLRNTGNVTLDPKVQLKAEGLFGRTLLTRDLSKVPGELLPGQQVKLTEPWAGAPQLEWGDVTLTARAQDLKESASASFFALPWLAALLLFGVFVAGAVAVVRVRRGRARLS
ncbi:WxL protein peptidoglycan domain-containing protein [Streptomyces beijiangensis]|uniref:DUF916 domain-containing protein n=1 Tax=Streptomyces beijiangensis TaxID=163361 RepID=A0A939FC19_9ACTN|nr:DUF916 domain-containing protein [Streptomyces beijiangensis]MBO0515456.1 DUF916 domain-containing protein [Streptomyces beijiangensis]